MRKLPIRGASLAAPAHSKGKLRDVLGKLGVIAAFSDADVDQLYMAIAQVFGAWLAEQEAMQVTPVASALRNVGKSLMETSKLFQGRETGLRNQVELGVTSLAAEFLALDPTVGGLEKAQLQISTFQKEAVRISHACLIAYADLTRKLPNDGRAPSLWYDEFTALLLGVAQKAGIEPNLNKDRTSQERGGWLFDAAQALEPFLDPWMRSPSPEACGKRLERSRKRLLNARLEPRPRKHGLELSRWLSGRWREPRWSAERRARPKR